MLPSAKLGVVRKIRVGSLNLPLSSHKKTPNPVSFPLPRSVLRYSDRWTIPKLPLAYYSSLGAARQSSL